MVEHRRASKMVDKLSLESLLGNKHADPEISQHGHNIVDFSSSNSNNSRSTYDNNYQEDIAKKSRLEVLAEETFTQTLTGGSQEDVNDKIRTFLAEESIIGRTRDCKKYFADHVTPIGAAIQVRPNID